MQGVVSRTEPGLVGRAVGVEAGSGRDVVAEVVLPDDFHDGALAGLFDEGLVLEHCVVCVCVRRVCVCRKRQREAVQVVESY